MSAPLCLFLPPCPLPTTHIPSRHRHVPLPTPRVFSRPSSSHCRPPVKPLPGLPCCPPVPLSPHPPGRSPYPLGPAFPPEPLAPYPPAAAAPPPLLRPGPPARCYFYPAGAGAAFTHRPPAGHAWGRAGHPGMAGEGEHPDNSTRTAATPQSSPRGWGARSRAVRPEGHRGHGHLGQGQGDLGVTGTRARRGTQTRRGCMGDTEGTWGTWGTRGARGGHIPGGQWGTQTHGGTGHTGIARAGRRDTGGPGETKNRGHRGGDREEGTRSPPATPG